MRDTRSISDEIASSDARAADRRCDRFFAWVEKWCEQRSCARLEYVGLEMGIGDALIASMQKPCGRKSAAFALGIGGRCGERCVAGTQPREHCDTFGSICCWPLGDKIYESVNSIFEHYANRSMVGAYGSRPTGALSGWNVDQINSVFRW